MEIENWYHSNFEAHLKGRYITLETVKPLLDGYKNRFEITVPGTSENGKDIHLVKIGSGKKIFLAWSQMHGNESTTTKALFDFIKFLGQREYFQKEIQQFLKTHSLYIIPILNPDGAELYTRENANDVDLNRDFQDLSQRESRCLRAVFDELKPNGCLNMHDQRTIYGFDDGLPATVSFLSPAADVDRSMTKARKLAMEGIVRMNWYLQKIIPGQVGRYDDSFNPACVGDTFQMAGTPTILFEAGHYKNDYQRESTREFIFYALLAFFDIIGENQEINYKDYFNIPENRKNYRDFIIRNVKLRQFTDYVDIAIQYSEVLKDGAITFEPVVDEVGKLEDSFGHGEEDADGSEILTKNDKNLTNGVKVSEIIGFGKKIPTSFH